MARRVVVVHRRPHVFAWMLLAFIGVSAAVALWYVALPLALLCLAVWLLARRGRRIRSLTTALTVGGWYAMSPAGFEVAVAQLLSLRGFTRVRVVGRSGDEGTDILAVDEAGRRVVVQAKRWAMSAKVGSVAIQNLLGAAAIRHADRAMLVTTAGFTPAALDLADRMDVDLIDGAALVAQAERVTA